ncbi:protein-associating with the carboxyl-terminal domain of ezrin-like isoform X1 [Leptotrombidium deliense]|uniref:Protein-associating with the carboxyl-terminal domain of ezrin-like isoform X1 n=1 Tax=Leptotrombidium deliense TaxID=299467 RepID=A0A443SMQ3_9ACAR|nr:protein-associating with the carboxyl-terminal domain of ezrin-like isoform X1 [Leptotrombidium deliense]
MGNENSLQRKVDIQSQPFFACSQYSAHNCHDSDLKPFTLLAFNANESNFSESHWRSIRHPFVVKYRDCGTFRSKKCVVTEPVTPLLQVLNSLTVEEIISGIHNICEALSFVHEKCKLSHNTLSLDAIFVSTTSHTWKLGCFQFATQVGEESSDILKGLRNYKKDNSISIPPEETNSMKPITNEQYLNIRDVYSLGFIIQQLIGEKDIKLSENLRNLSHQLPEQRPKVSLILNDELFEKCNFLKVISFLAKFASFTECDKEKFLETLVDRLRLIPSVLLASKLIPLLLTSRVLLLHSKADQLLLPHLLTPIQTDIVQKPLVNESLFEAHIIPIICKLYCVHKIQVRLILLRYLPYYASYIPVESLKEHVLPQTLLGLKDESDELVSATFVGISKLVEIFGAELILGQRRKIFHNVVPKQHSIPKINCSQKLQSSPVLLIARSEPDGGETEDLIAATCPATLEPVSPEKLEWEIESKETISEKIVPEEPRRSSKTFNSDLDIKSMKISLREDNEVDLLFGAMEPKFSKAASVIESNAEKRKTDKKCSHSSKFDIQCDDITSESGWGDEDNIKAPKMEKTSYLLIALLCLSIAINILLLSLRLTTVIERQCPAAGNMSTNSVIVDSEVNKLEQFEPKEKEGMDESGLNFHVSKVFKFIPGPMKVLSPEEEHKFESKLMKKPKTMDEFVDNDFALKSSLDPFGLPIPGSKDGEGKISPFDLLKKMLGSIPKTPNNNRMQIKMLFATSPRKINASQMHNFSSGLVDKLFPSFKFGPGIRMEVGSKSGEEPKMESSEQKGQGSSNSENPPLSKTNFTKKVRPLLFILPRLHSHHFGMIGDRPPLPFPFLPPFIDPLNSSQNPFQIPQFAQRILEKLHRKKEKTDESTKEKTSSSAPPLTSQKPRFSFFPFPSFVKFFKSGPKPILQTSTAGDVITKGFTEPAAVATAAPEAQSAQRN